VSATSPRSQIVKRLQDMIPSLGKVQGVVSLESAFQGNVKAETAYVYRFLCEATGSKPGQEDQTKLRGRGSQIVIDQYAIVVSTKNVKDVGGDDSSDVNDDIVMAISIALLGWIPPGSVFPIEYVRGQLDFQRNLLIWTEIYALRRILQTMPHHRIVPMNEKLFHAKAVEPILKGMPICLNSEGKISAATLENFRVMGFAKADAAIGNSVPFSSDGIISMENWTVITGTETLVPGAYYYLGNAHFMQIIPPESGYVVTLGRAVSANVFDIEIESPIEI